MHQSLKRPIPVWFITTWFLVWPSMAIIDYVEFVMNNDVSIGYYLDAFGSQVACILAAVFLYMRSTANIWLFGGLLAWTVISILLAFVNGSLPINSSVITYALLLFSVGLYVVVLLYALKLKTTGYYSKNA